MFHDGGNQKQYHSFPHAVDVVDLRLPLLLPETSLVRMKDMVDLPRNQLVLPGPCIVRYEPPQLGISN